MSGLESGRSHSAAVPMGVLLNGAPGLPARLDEGITAALARIVKGVPRELGPEVAGFESEFAAFTGSHFCVGVNSGTSALHLALMCAGVGFGDEVITVPMTAIATASAISYCGAIPVFVDVDPVHFCMDVDQVAKQITKKTRAILPVHLYGQTPDMDALTEVGRRHGIAVIEDAAQALGARYRGRVAGTMGICGCFSFSPGKSLSGAGEAGAVVTDDPNVAARLRCLQNHGDDGCHRHTEIGFNYRMGVVQAAVLRIKLAQVQDLIERRRLLAGRYRQLVSEPGLQLPAEDIGRRHVWHLYVATHGDRDRIRAELAARGIETGLHYPIPLHLQKAFRHLRYREGDFPVAERLARECITLPLFPEMTMGQHTAVVDALSEVLSEDL